MHVTLVSYIVDEILINFIELKEFVESLSKMAIVETAWEKFLESDSEVPPDVFFLVKGEDEGIGKDSSRTIGAHREFPCWCESSVQEDALWPPEGVQGCD